MSLIAENQAFAQQTLLEEAESYLRESVAPKASEIDSNPAVLKEVLKQMGDRSLLALRVPKVWGGMEVSNETFRNFQQLVARYSGALAFLQIQHQGAAGLISYSENESLKQRYLPQIAKGEIFVGIGFSQLRRKGEPLIKALQSEGGYKIEGKVPWVTGFGFFKDFIVGALLPDNRAIYGMVPFTETYQEAGGTISFSEPMQLSAMQSTNTVSATFTNWFLPEENVVLVTKEAGTIHENDKKNVLFAGFLALGCARAGLDIVETAAKTKQMDFLYNAFESLNDEFTRCQTAMMDEIAAKSQSFEENLQLRVWAINLAGRCAQAAVTVSSGAANYKHHAAQRVYREALMFTVSGQTTEVMEATLARLVHDS
ncbi:MAG: acyl-CoA dehydrogenase family protein [Cyanobacteria bacterium P01_D01_bin.50]